MVRALILCGGESIRLGRPKHLEKINNKYLYQHWIELFSSLGIPSFLSVNKNQDIPFENATLIIDELSSQGPLCGLISAFKLFPKDDWLVMACDLVYVEKQHILDLLKGKDDNCDAVAFINPEQNLPFALLTLYKPTARTYLDFEFSSEKKSALAALKKMHTLLIEPTDSRILKGINSPGDWQEWQAHQSQ